ncbi:Uncharacterized protein TCM_034912 [Theobroma cacao]|uniref:RNase H type-1 domain-containing protein n=1 Tax=Theobroma cacao TaxID=3641 RepID=A0A061FH01_THECC|nr:Uncharacterized protein TCM_034912 [Theobroma cacao]
MCFQSWFDMSRSLENGKVMRMAFYIISWSNWLTRNEVVFERKEWSELNVFNLIKLRLAWWVKTKWPNLNPSLLDIIRYPNEGLPPQRTQPGMKMVSWVVPSLGFLKLNLDVAVNGCQGEVGNGGVLRHGKGSIPLIFSLPMGVTDSNTAELLAIWKGFQIVAPRPQGGLTLTTLFLGVTLRMLSWAPNPHKAPWKLRRTLMRIEELKSKIAC